MRFIQQHRDNPSVFEVAWMWLPSFIGQNASLLNELDKALTEKFQPPVEVNDRKLDEIHQFVIDWICDQIKIKGLWHYLSAIERVTGGD